MSAIDILREKGLKKSAQRISIINILLDKQIPLTESDIEVEMGDMYDRITFYRTIQTLLEKGVIHRITIDSTTVKYALNTAQSHSHIHFYCKMCHAVTCFKEIPIEIVFDVLVLVIGGIISLRAKDNFQKRYWGAISFCIGLVFLWENAGWLTIVSETPAYRFSDLLNMEKMLK